ncbi:hypothetical protein FQN50_000048 [Emmonsiellopsis sp. PD_5]|nr:hypothetical protein FQN50_000048 [Emmonsiellopsis sp. PD_5]
MTGEKRSRESPQDPASRKKQAHEPLRFEGDDDAAPSSSQAALEQPEGSSQPPARKRAKHPPLFKIVPEEKSAWRQCETVKDLFDLTGWNSKEFLSKLEQRFQLDYEGTGIPFSTWLIKLARGDLREIQSPCDQVCGTTGKNIRWTKLVLDSIPLTYFQENDLIYAWIKVKEIDYLLTDDRDHAEKYADLLADILAPPDIKVSDKMIKAFHGKEKAVKPKRATTKPEGTAAFEEHDWTNVPSGTRINLEQLERSLRPPAPPPPDPTIVAFYSKEEVNSNGRRPSQEVFDKTVEYYNLYRTRRYMAPYTTIVGPSGIGKSFSVQQLAVHHGLYVVYSSLADGESPGYPPRSVIADRIHPSTYGLDRLVRFWESYIIISLMHVEICKRVGISPAGFYNLQVRKEYKRYQDSFSSAVFLLDSADISFYSLFIRKAKPMFEESLNKYCQESTKSLSEWLKTLKDNDHNPDSPPRTTQEKTPEAVICIDEARALLDHNESRRCELFDGSGKAIHRAWGFGRPLWGRKLRSGVGTMKVTELAWQKLRGHGTAWLLALLSYRINFDVIRLSLAEEMVSKHLRFVVYMSPSGDLMRTTQPSEPILANAAAEQMLDSKIRREVIAEFVNSSLEGSINPGDFGEMVGALLLLFANDKAQRTFQRAFLPMLIHLDLFMESLFGKTVRDDITDRMGTDTEMKALWESGTVSFSHFVKLNKKPTKETLQLAFNRGAALFLPDWFPGANILIPVRIPGAEDLSFCLIRVKNSKDDKLTAGLENLATDALADAQKDLFPGANYLGIVMCLRGSADDGGQSVVIATPTLIRHTRSRARARGQRGTAAASIDTTRYHWPQKSKQLVVVGMGFDETIYPHVNSRGAAPEERIDGLLQELLACVPDITVPKDGDQTYVDGMMPLG